MTNLGKEVENRLARRNHFFMNHTSVPVVKDLVLVGGGHSHVAILKSFGMKPMAGVRLTLICREVSTPYSGMVPGYIAGHYHHDQAHIDLDPLCNFAGARFLRSRAIGLDLNSKRVLCEDRPSVSFDFLSINIGSTPRANDVPGVASFALPIKPIDQFLKAWEEILVEVEKTDSPSLRIAVIGGGAGGVELALSAQHRLLCCRAASGKHPLNFDIHLVTESLTLLPTHNRVVQSKFTRILQQRGVHVHVHHRVVEVQPGQLLCAPPKTIPFDFALWVTQAAPAPWIAQSGLQTDADGFVAVNDFLQSSSHPFVFAAGDVAAMMEHPRPKSGVFAVRQGQALARNLRLALTEQPLQPFRPQRNFLSLISTGNRYAVASRGPWAWEGKWVWRLKDWIDRRWMRKYQELRPMETKPAPLFEPGLADAETLREISASGMRCGGCGAKVGSTVLRRVLRRLNPVPNQEIVIGLEVPDDAAVFHVPPGKVSVQTVDFFRSFINDPFLFGRITANHCLGDIFAMGAEPRLALAIVSITYSSEAKSEEELFQVMSGAMATLREHQTSLAGGHTSEGPELAFGLVVTGVADAKQLMRKSGMKPGDRLILTQPLGIGTLFAAEMRRQAKGRWIDEAITTMLLSNRGASQCFLRHGAHACTDVTGFGLVGHLLEMAKASGVSSELFLSAIPVLSGAMETTSAGIFSSLQPQNLRSRHAIRNLEEVRDAEKFPLLFDPQTGGGLLASVRADAAEVCLADLRKEGYANAAVIGVVQAQHKPATPIAIQR